MQMFLAPPLLRQIPSSAIDLGVVKQLWQISIFSSFDLILLSFFFSLFLSHKKKLILNLNH
jgi:hypothetical protein